MPKRKQNKKKVKDIDYTAEGVFDKNRAIIYIEHTLECPIFQIKAEEFLTYLQKQFPNKEFALIRNQFGKQIPRTGAFEIELSQNAKTSRYNLWSGLDKGPPRRDKFPNFDELLPEVQKVLKKFYPDIVINPEDDVADTDEEQNTLLE